MLYGWEEHMYRRPPDARVRRAPLSATLPLLAVLATWILATAAVGAVGVQPPSDTALARLINVTRSDLPSPASWAASAQTANTAAQVADAQAALKCANN